MIKRSTPPWPKEEYSPVLPLKPEKTPSIVVQSTGHHHRGDGRRAHHDVSQCLALAWRILRPQHDVGELLTHQVLHTPLPTG